MSYLTIGIIIKIFPVKQQNDNIKEIMEHQFTNMTNAEKTNTQPPYNYTLIAKVNILSKMRL